MASSMLKTTARMSLIPTRKMQMRMVWGMSVMIARTPMGMDMAILDSLPTPAMKITVRKHQMVQMEAFAYVVMKETLA